MIFIRNNHVRQDLLNDVVMVEL